MRKKAIAILAAGTVLLGVAAVPAQAVTPTNVEYVSRVTGKSPDGETLPSPNQTHTNYHVWGTDLGIMWDEGNGNVMIAFGDTDGSKSEPDWRSNVLAISDDADLTDGLSISSMVTKPNGRAKQVLPSLKKNNIEQTVIPTAGIAVGSRQYIHYMSVNHWGTDGDWRTNYSGLAYSDDEGLTWTKDPEAKWMNDRNGTNKFQQAAFAKQDGFVYMFGTINGRFGNVFLARVPENDMLSKDAYEYWDGNAFQYDETLVKPVAIGTAGEMSVAYNSHFNKWFMMYKSKARQAVVLREADSLTGPWGGEKLVKIGAGLYGPFIHPWFNDGTDLYFTVSRWKPEYNVFLMKAELTEDMLGGNIVSDPGFEDQGSSKAEAPWSGDGNAAVDRQQGSAHSGSNNGVVSGTDGTHSITQKIVVAPHTSYTLKGWIRTSANLQDGSFGVRLTNGGNVLNETKFAAMPDYTELNVSFTSGDIAIVEIYVQLAAGEDEAWLQLDDVSVNAAETPAAEPEESGE